MFRLCFYVTDNETHTKEAVLKNTASFVTV